jgi:CheY-like chemotaxis protein/predicted regulator of Ras-like GTPase activity (Roadblock/LC7/MglB family)
MQQRRPKILLVDNDKTIVSSVKDYLSSYVDCLGASSYEDAIATLEKERDIALVISEMRMPGRDGFDLLLWLRENRPKIQMVMTTAYGSPLVKSLAKQKGAVMYLEKPLNPKQVKDTVQVILEHKGFSVAIQDMEFTDLLQFLSFSGRAVKVIVTNTLGEEGEIGLEGDKVLWVRTKSRVGEEAFYEIVQWEGGGFEMRPLPGEERTREGQVISLSYLLIEGARRKDEGSHPELKERRSRGEKEREKPPTPRRQSTNRGSLHSIFEELTAEIPDVLVAEIVNIEEGTPLVVSTGNPAFDPEIAAAYYSEVVKVNEKALAVLKKGGRLEEVLLTVDDFYLILRVLPSTRFAVCLALGKKGNVGMARMEIKKFAKRFIEIWPAD